MTLATQRYVYRHALSLPLPTAAPATGTTTTDYRCQRIAPQHATRPCLNLADLETQAYSCSSAAQYSDLACYPEAQNCTVVTVLSVSGLKGLRFMIDMTPSPLRRHQPSAMLQCLNSFENADAESNKVRLCEDIMLSSQD